jgi:hypothetical protein
MALIVSAVWLRLWFNLIRTGAEITQM